MAAPHHHQPSRPSGSGHTRADKHVKIEEVPDDQKPSGILKDDPLSGGTICGGASHHYLVEGHHPQKQQSKDQEGHRAPSPGQDCGTKQPPRDHGAEQKANDSAQSQTHQQFSAPAVGATPQAPGVLLHTTANPTMALGASQGFPLLPKHVCTGSQLPPPGSAASRRSPAHT